MTFQQSHQLDERILDELIKKSQTVDLDSFTRADISSFIQAFTLSSNSTIRSKAFVLLSALCQKAHGTLAGEKGSETLASLFGSQITDALTETNDTALRTGICTLDALFQVDWPAAEAILCEEGVIENIMEGVDFVHSTRLEGSVAHLLGQASGYKRCREIIQTQPINWLKNKCQQSSNLSLRAAAAVALVKYSRGVVADAPEAPIPENTDDNDQEAYLANMMKSLIVNADDREPLSDAVEALAYLSIKPEIKETLSSDSKFLRQLFSLIPRKKSTSTSQSIAVDSAMTYGTLVVISNICAYRPRLSEDQAQLEKLKKMAQAMKKNNEVGQRQLSILESDESVRARIHRLIDAGALGVIGSALTVSDTVTIRLLLGKTLLNIVEDTENRGKVLQSGGAKTLSILIKHALESLTPQNQILDARYLETIQALAKLSITSSPLHVFGPDLGVVFDAIRPLSVLLQHSSSTLLQRFEASMALTNLSSYQPQVAERIARAEGLLGRVELLMFEDHVLMRRSAVELICNLVAGSDDVFERYCGTLEAPGATSKLQILIALVDVDDLPTVLAASGALAALTCSPHACLTLSQLQQQRKRVLPVLTQLIDPSTGVSLDEVHDNHTIYEHPGLVHRALVCVKNLLANTSDHELRKALKKDAESTGLVKGLEQLVKGEGLTKEPSILILAAETLKVVMEDKESN